MMKALKLREVVKEFHDICICMPAFKCMPAIK